MGKRKTFDEILMERYGTNTDESTGVDEVSYDDVMLDRRLRGKYSDEWTPKMTKDFNKGVRYSKSDYDNAIEMAKNGGRTKTGAERYGMFASGNEELNKGILHRTSNFIKSKMDDGKKEISEKDSLKHAKSVLSTVSDGDKALLKQYVDAQDSQKSMPFRFLNDIDSPVMQKQQMKDNASMVKVKKQFMENTGVDEKTFNKLVANYGYEYHAKENEKQKKELQASGKATKALASAVDVMVSPVTGLVSMAGTGKNQIDPELGRDNHTVYSSLKDFSENTEEAAVKDAENIDNKVLSNVSKYGYQVLMATGKSAMSAATGGEVASALGLTGKSARAVANIVSLPQFGASAYESTLEDAQERGLDTKNAYQTALVAGMAEMATEVISLEGIWDIMEQQGKVAAKGVVANTLKQGFFEGSEEASSDLINEIADGIINKDKSKYVQSVNYYMSDQYAKENGLPAPLTEEEAKKKANIDFAKEVGQDFLMGAASGALMGGAATGINTWSRTQAGKSIAGNEAFLNDIVENENSENYISDDRADYNSDEDYQKAQNTILQVIDDSGEKVSGKEARNLYDNVVESIESQNARRAENRIKSAVNTIENAQTPEDFVRATENVSVDAPEVRQAIENTKARLSAQGATQADFDNVVTPQRAYNMAKKGELSEQDMNNLQGEMRHAAEVGQSESLSNDIKNVSKFDASTVLVKENGKAKQMKITGEVTKEGSDYYLSTKNGKKVVLEESILSGETKVNGDNTRGKLLMYGNSHAAGIVSLEDPELMTVALQTKIAKPELPSTSIVHAVKTFNTLGRSGVSYESIMNNKKQKFMIDAIGEKTLRKAYDLGLQEGAADEKSMANPTTVKGNGKITFTNAEVEHTYNNLDKANRTFLEKFAEKTGVGIEMFADDSDAEGTVRGQYVPGEGKMRLNIAEDTDILEVAMHEGIGEFLKAHNAEGYAEITETILNYYAENNADALAERIEDYKRAYSDEKGKTTRGSADELVNDVLAEIFADDTGIEKLGNWLFDTGKEQEAKTIKDVLINFINQMKSWIADIKAQGGLSNAERSRLSMAEKDIAALQDRILKAMDEAIENRDSRADGKIAEQDVRNSVKVDANGKQYVEIDEDIIKGITGSKNIKSAVRTYIKENYPSIDMMGFKLGVNAQSRNEFANSKTSQYMQSRLKRFFIDKMRMARNLEEIVNVGDGYTWEDIKHSRKDKLIGFVRGNVQIRVGSNDYIADIVLANDKTKGLIFYDIVNMKSTVIKKAPTERTHENHVAQVVGTSKDSISKTGENATQIVKKVAQKGRKSVRVDIPVSANDELVAIHNTTPQQLIDTIKLGGFPSPSIAVVKAAMGHEKYGTVSVVFGRESIDPEVSKKNRIYGGDAWTAVFPKVEFKINDDVIYRVRKYLDENLPSNIREIGGYDCLDINNAENMLGKGGLKDSRYASDPKFGYLFITKEDGLGRKLEIPMKEAESKSGLSASELEAVIAKVGANKLSEIKKERNRYFDFSEELPSILNEIHYKEYVNSHPDIEIDSLPVFKQKIIKQHYNPKFWNLMKTDRVLEDIETLSKGNGFGSTVDEYTLRDEIKEIVENNKDAYEKWIENLFDGVFEKQGLRNNKDIYDNMGNERSWEDLHEKITLDNIVKLMNEEDDQGAAGMFSQSVIQALATKKFKSIDDMKSSMNQLQMMSDEEYSAEKEKYFDKFSAIVNTIQNKNADNQFIAYQQATDAIADAVREGTDEQTIMRELRRYGGLDLQADTAKRISNLMSDLSEMVTGYFEAKPKRAVYLDEILKVVCPSTEVDLVDVLEQNDIPYETYEEGNEEARKEAVNSTENARFSKKVDSRGSKLSEGQQDYFKESKVRNEDGNLLVMYHGTPNNDFYVFDAKKSKGSNLYGRGFYFAYDNSTSGYYDGENGRILECYLNIKNPVDTTTGKTISDSMLHDIVSTIADEYGIENYGYYATVESVTENLAKKTSDFGILQDLNATCVGDFTEMLKFLNDEVGTNYDGIIAQDQVIAFYPNQIKLTNNLKPTVNDDIRYSRKVEQARKSIKEYGVASPYTDSLNEVNIVSSILGKMNESLNGVTVNYDVVTSVADQIAKKYEANMEQGDLAVAIWKVFDYMNQNKIETDYQGMMDYLLNIGDEVIATSHKKDPEQKALYDSVRKSLREHAIKLTDADKQELIHKFGTWKEAFGAIQQAGINLNNNGIEIDSLYGDIREEIMNKTGIQMSEQTTASDQIISIIDTVGALEPGAYLWEGANDMDKSLAVATDIMDEYYSRAAEEMTRNVVDGTDAGKQTVKKEVDKQVAKLRKEMQQYKKTVREAYQDQVERYKTELERTQKDLRAVQNNFKNWKPTPETKVLNQSEIDAKAKEMAMQSLNSYKEAQEKNKQIENIRRTGHRMIRWLDAPTDKQHVPEFLQRPLSEFLSSVDFLPQRASEKSKNTLAWKAKMIALKDVISRLDESNPEIDSDGYALSQVLVVDELIEKMQNLLDNNQDVNMKVSKLPAGDLKAMSEILSSLSAAINNMNSTYANAVYADIEKLARASVQEMQERKPTNNKRTKMGNRLYNFFNLDEVEPVTYFEGLGSAATSVFQELRQGFDVRTNHIKDTADFFEKKKKELDISDKEMVEWGKQQHVFHFKEGEIILTTPEIMSLLETVKRKQGKPHVEAGGIRVSDTEIKAGKVKKIVHMTKAVHITEEQYQQIVSKLTPKQVQMADALQQYMATECANWGNRVSKKMFGYKKFTEKDYFPLKTDASARAVRHSDEQAPSYYTIKNRSFTKQIIPHSTNAVVIDDIFNVFTMHVVQMAEYDGYTMPIADAMRWYNYQEKDLSAIMNSDQLGEIAADVSISRNDIRNSVKQNIDRVMGAKAGAYFQQFIKDINGDYAGTGGTPDISTYLMSAFKAQAVGTNIRVILQQPTAIIRAADRIEPKYLLQAQASLPKAAEYAKKSQNNSVISYWKAQGYYETLIGKSLKQIITGEGSTKEKITDAMGKGAGVADDLTWGIMYRAAELKVMDEKPQLKYDSEEFTKETVKIFEDIVDHTQVVDTIFHKSQWMRNQGLGYRSTSAFMAEPTKTYNMLYRAYQDCVKSGNKKEMINRAGKTAMIFFIEQAVNAWITALIDAERDDDKDEGWKGFWESQKGHASDNLLGNINPVNLFPVIKEFTNIIEGYSSTEYTTEGLYTAGNTAKELMLMAQGKSTATLYGKLYKVAEGISQLSGIPLASAIREVKALHNTFNGLWDGDDWYKTETTKNKKEKAKRQNVLTDVTREGDLNKSKQAMHEIYDNVYQKQLDDGKDKAEAESRSWTAVREALKKAYKEQIEDAKNPTVVNNRFVTLLQRTKRKVSGKNKYETMTEKQCKDMIKKWSE